VQRRVVEYRAKTAPLIEFYRQRGLLLEIDGAQPIEQVSADMLAAVKRAAGQG
jgi:adenylate kinase